MTTRGRRLIFSANPGRSGSAYLASLLDLSAMIDAGHERLPAMTGPWLRAVSHRGTERSFQQRRLKIAAIERELGQLDVGQVYADTSHMFIKTFADVVFDAFDHDRITVLSIRRDPLLIAKSYFELGLLGPNAGTWHDWMLPPTAPAAAFHLDRAAVTGQFDLIFGCLVDTFVREERWRQAAPNVRWIDVELDAAATADGAANLFDELHVPVPDGLSGFVGTVANAKPVEKTRAGLACSLELVAERWGDFVNRFGSRPEVQRFVARSSR